jgi:protein SCO1/2
MSKAPSSPVRRWLPLVGFAVIAIVIAAVVVLPRLQSASTGAGGVGGPFTLLDKTGKTVTDKDFRGKLMLVYFGYTFCPDVCPTTLGIVGQALDKLTPDERKQVAPIFITVDPDRDTPKVMGEYAANFAPDLVGLTGSPDAIQQVEHEYHVYAKKHEEKDGSYSMDHSSIIYLMGKDGGYRGLVSGEVTVAQMVTAIRKYL